jgi:hypothetical protein
MGRVLGELDNRHDEPDELMRLTIAAIRGLMQFDSEAVSPSP